MRTKWETETFNEGEEKEEELVIEEAETRKTNDKYNEERTEEGICKERIYE